MYHKAAVSRQLSALSFQHSAFSLNNINVNEFKISPHKMQFYTPVFG